MRETVYVRFVFTPPADHASGLLTLPWSVPLEDWRDDRLVEIRQRGISRHVVRFVYDDGTLYALKELSERLARREYRVLRALAGLQGPAPGHQVPHLRGDVPRGLLPPAGHPARRRPAGRTSRTARPIAPVRVLLG